MIALSETARLPGSTALRRSSLCSATQILPPRSQRRPDIRRPAPRAPRALRVVAGDSRSSSATRRQRRRHQCPAPRENKQAAWRTDALSEFRLTRDPLPEGRDETVGVAFPGHSDRASASRRASGCKAWETARPSASPRSGRGPAPPCRAHRTPHLTSHEVARVAQPRLPVRVSPVGPHDTSRASAVPRPPGSAPRSPPRADRIQVHEHVRLPEPRAKPVVKAPGVGAALPPAIADEDARTARGAYGAAARYRFPGRARRGGPGRGREPSAVRPRR